MLNSTITNLLRALNSTSVNLETPNFNVCSSGSPKYFQILIKKKKAEFTEESYKNNQQMFVLLLDINIWWYDTH